MDSDNSEDLVARKEQWFLLNSLRPLSQDHAGARTTLCHLPPLLQVHRESTPLASGDQACSGHGHRECPLTPFDGLRVLSVSLKHVVPAGVSLSAADVLMCAGVSVHACV